MHVMIGQITDQSVTGAAFSCYALRLSLSDPEPEPDTVSADMWGDPVSVNKYS